MRLTSGLCLVSLVALLGACHALPPQWGGTRAPAETVQKTQPLAAEPVLYARDGSVVNSDAAAAGLPRREVQNSEGTRTKLLELYERVVEDRDRLSLALSMREAELATTKEQLAKETLRTTDLEAKWTTAESARVDLARQNLELASRLTTAQIRRLEAEKQVLELSLATPATPSKTIAASMDAGRNAPKPEAPPAAAPAASPTHKPVEHHR